MYPVPGCKMERLLKVSYERLKRERGRRYVSGEEVQALVFELRVRLKLLAAHFM